MLLLYMPDLKYNLFVFANDMKLNVFKHLMKTDMEYHEKRGCHTSVVPWGQSILNTPLYLYSHNPIYNGIYKFQQILNYPIFVY